MRAGTLIRYRLRLHGIPLRWSTRISEWKPPHGFVDEQTSGPYRLWHHQHTFHQRGGKTVVRDHVRYAVLGDKVLQPLFVGRDLRKIFDYRQARILELARHGWRSCQREETCAP
jgi:ligand-binding SRPBCC domain-containing protein